MNDQQRKECEQCIVDLKSRTRFKYLSLDSFEAIAAFKDVYQAALASESVMGLVEALLIISRSHPVYVGDFSINSTPSDFGNAEDYAYEMDRIVNAGTGDVAREALAAFKGEPESKCL